MEKKIVPKDPSYKSLGKEVPEDQYQVLRF